ncbi:MAG: HNH endonuclease [Devosia marina]|uniref:HNH endonuclease n=1 Tax=Devosia marina TaxID=2683198 RepID=UPI0032ED78C2
MARSVPEWIGKTEDSKIPDRVKLRVREREGDVCYLSGRKIMPGDIVEYDHRIALINWTGDGHGNRESNIYPVIKAKHREKTRQDVAEKAASARVRSKHLGIRKAPTMRSAGFAKAPKQRTASRPIEKWSLLK